jgi:uncharacterized membrane protein
MTPAVNIQLLLNLKTYNNRIKTLLVFFGEILSFINELNWNKTAKVTAL